MKWGKATNHQLWAIMRGDANCPSPLMEGAFHEAVNRGLIERFILSVMKKKGMTTKQTRSVLRMSHEDLIQLGYEGALKALKTYQPGKGTFTNLLFLNISHAYGMEFAYVDAQKRQREEVSYNMTFDDGGTMEYYLIDHHTNVEKTVLTKLQLKEKLSLLNAKQKETFLRFYAGYTYNEIAEQMHTKKATVGERLQRAFVLMTGKRINITKLGIFERTSYKTQGA